MLFTDCKRLQSRLDSHNLYAAAGRLSRDWHDARADIYARTGGIAVADELDT